MAKMTPIMAHKASFPNIPLPTTHSMDESKKHEMAKGDANEDRKEAKPNSKAPLGQGGRFVALKQKLASQSGVTDPAALAASIGRKKYGKAKFQSLAIKGRA